MSNRYFPKVKVIAALAALGLFAGTWAVLADGSAASATGATQTSATPTPTPAPTQIPAHPPTPAPTPKVIRKIATSVTLTGPAQVVAGQPATYTAVPSVSAPGRISFTVPGGDCQSLPIAASVTCTVTFSDVGASHTVTATTSYYPLSCCGPGQDFDYDYVGSTSNVVSTVVVATATPTPTPVVIQKIPTTLTLSGPTQVGVGRPATYIAVPSVGAPGTISFQVDGADSAACPPVQISSSPATCTITETRDAKHTVVASSTFASLSCCGSGQDFNYDYLGATSNSITTLWTEIPTPTPSTPPTPSSPPTPAPTPAPAHIVFAANGTISIPTINGTGKVGPGSVSSDVNLRSGAFTGTAKLPAMTINANLFGFIPTTVVSTFTELGPLTGQLAPGAGDLTADLKASIGVTSAKALGVLPLTSGNCVTASPVSIHLASDGTGKFSPFSGGVVASKFAIGPLTHCGVLTSVLNAILPGPNNTLTLTLVAQN
ncbi:hypothetical protein SAMN05444157_0648 [Frankineae bacterium MT45]|nr:hypothetical protein SAMN05444157_0648 [Frankineae bacterium MT45]